MKPNVLLIAPPVYDFALYDLYLKPYSLLSLGRAFEKSGYTVHLINGLDYREENSIKTFGSPRLTTREYLRQLKQIIRHLPGKNRLITIYTREYSPFWILRI